MMRAKLPSAQFLKLTQEIPAIAEVKAMTTNELIARYVEVFGERSRSRNRQHLVRSIAWKVQERESGGLSAETLARLALVGQEAPRPWRRRLAALSAKPVPVPPAKGEPVGKHARRAPDEPLALAAPLQPPQSARLARPTQLRDPRLPPAGTVLRREYQSSVHEVRVLADGFLYREVRYTSLSRVAKEITGTEWNGFAFFRIRAKKDPSRVAAE